MVDSLDENAEELKAEQTNININAEKTILRILPSFRVEMNLRINLFSAIYYRRS